MRDRASLALIGAICLLNGWFIDYLPLWRQMVFLLLVILAYLHGRHCQGRNAWAILGAAAVPGFAVMPLNFATGFGAVACLGVFVLLPWLAGRFRRQQADLVHAGRARVTQLERERELVAEQAELRERARIAADMHDSLGHELALIAVRAGALELDPELGDRHRAAVAQLRESATTATDRLRHTVGLLREKAAAPTNPADESIAALVDRARAAGLAVELRQPALLTLPLPVATALHRVVQESLTNASRHAPGTAVTVRIDQLPEVVTVTVRNTAPAEDGAEKRESPGGGSGLASLRERVSVLGGDLHAGPDDDGFAVIARIPFEQTGIQRR
ncbi:sensor histidine kinase [Nocardia crassostreae]|uniref:sensor histidine kinase n=1 Tax=Nocardia crassostreae TaxID=53428 RepID=UPI000A006AE4|nr:histidine kinase [Nocardia crassostreae]